jgi:hypothetical protein
LNSISRESKILTVICLTDMFLTLAFVHLRLAVEQNPLMAACLNKGPWVFVGVKLLSFVPFIIVAELHRRRNPAFVRAATRCAIVLYAGIYTLLFIGINFHV